MNQSMIRLTLFTFAMPCVWVTAIVFVNPHWFGVHAFQEVRTPIGDTALIRRLDTETWSLTPALILTPGDDAVGGDLYFGTDIPALKSLVSVVGEQTTSLPKSNLSPLLSIETENDTVTTSSFARSTTHTYSAQPRNIIK